MTLIFCLSKSQNIFQLNSYSNHTSVYTKEKLKT